MDINHILFLVAVLNLGGDLINIFRFRDRLPSWMLPLSAGAMAACLLAWYLASDISGYISAGVLAAYLVFVKVGTRNRTRAARPISAAATKVLIALHIAAFIYQYVNSPLGTVGEMVELGAFFSPYVEGGEWWRIFTAQFLHFGVLHLACNMLGLWFLGPLAEAIIGKLKFVVAYILSSCGGMLVAWLAYSLQGEQVFLLAGASAGVLGLVGLQGNLALRAYKSSGSLFAKAQLSAMGQIVLLQMIFDMMVPEVSSTAHLGGAASGFLVGFLVAPRGVEVRRIPDADPS